MPLGCFITDQHFWYVFIHAYYILGKTDMSEPIILQVRLEPMFAGWKTYILVTGTWLLIPLHKPSYLAIDFSLGSPRPSNTVSSLLWIYCQTFKSRMQIWLAASWKLMFLGWNLHWKESQKHYKWRCPFSSMLEVIN